MFITNSDVLPSVRRLGLTPRQTVYLPHATDSEKLFRFAATNAALCPPDDGSAHVFSPSRQDWVSHDPNWSKGNDRLIHGLRLAVDRGVPCRLRLVAWGRDVEATQRLVAELGLGEIVEWVPQLRKQGLWAEYLRSHAVVDQFVAPAIGGVTFEALALGRRVVTALDTAAAETFFGASPPVLVAATPEEVASALRRVAEDLDDTAGTGAAAREWFRAHHSSERIVDLQVEAYARLLEPKTRSSRSSPAAAH